MYSFGKRLKKIRRQKGLSQKELAARIDAKNSTVSNWEQGVARPDVDMLAVICAALEVSADELLDIKLPDDVYSDMEKQMIERYRNIPSMRLAVRVLLGLEETPHN